MEGLLSVPVNWDQSITRLECENGSQGRGKKNRGKAAPDRKAPEKAKERARPSSDSFCSGQFRQKKGKKEADRAAEGGTQSADLPVVVDSHFTALILSK
jgi:hypothetical protein